MSRRPFFSVVIPTFNDKEALERNFFLLASQTFKDFEVLVADGNSSDGTKAFLQAESRFTLKWTSQPDDGIYHAMNHALLRAKGQWYLFLGADDQLAAAETLEQMHAHLADSNLDILSGAVQYQNRNNALVPEVHQAHYGWKLRWKNTLHHQGTFYRSTLFALGGYDAAYRILADYHFNLRIWKAAKFGETTKTVVAIAGAQGVSKAFKWGQYLEEYRVKKRVLGGPAAFVQLPWLFSKFVAKQLAGISGR